MVVRGRYHLLKELEQLTHSWGTKSVAANKVITKYKETMSNVTERKEEADYR